MFICSVWVARNYQTWFGRLFKKVGALLVLAACYMLTFFAALFLDLLIEDQPQDFDIDHITLDGRGLAFLLVIVLLHLTVAAGLIVGLVQRRKRHTAWETEASTR